MFEKFLEKTWALLKKQFESPIQIGDKKRALAPDEVDPDEKELTRLTKIWRAMFHEDPWWKALMSHVRKLLFISSILFLAYFLAANLLPAKSMVFNWITVVVLAVLCWWFRVGMWYGVIERRVWEEFKKKFGKHFHRR